MGQYILDILPLNKKLHSSNLIRQVNTSNLLFARSVSFINWNHPMNLTFQQGFLFIASNHKDKISSILKTKERFIVNASIDPLFAFSHCVISTWEPYSFTLQLIFWKNEYFTIIFRGKQLSIIGYLRLKLNYYKFNKFNKFWKCKLISFFFSELEQFKTWKWFPPIYWKYNIF